MRVIAFILFFIGVGFIAKSQLVVFDFTGTGACPTQGNVPTIAPPSTLTVSALTRVGTNLNCEENLNGFATSGFSGPAIDLNDNYIELTLTADAGYYINISSLYFLVNRIGAYAPTYGRVAHDGGTGAFTAYNDFQITTSSSPIHWTSMHQFSSGSGGTVKFRIYGWNPNISSPSTSQLRLDQLTIFGSITTTPLGSLWVQNVGNNIFNSNAGSVGIGTDNPSVDFKLDVAGNIHTTGKLLIGTDNLTNLNDYAFAVNGSSIMNKLRIKTYATWPDYVFDNNYDLPTLKYLESYIKANRKLPGVPSAVAVAKDGFEVGESQAILLQKIEELTLYIIDLNKRLEQLEKDNAALKSLLHSN